jgi:type II secretory pathway pseudopilin PulG
MQRKNYTLRYASSRRTRPAIAMIMAIMVIVILATIMALSMQLSSETTKRSTDIYLQEQAVLLAKSAAEYTLLEISENNSTLDPCAISSLNFHQDIYDVNISVLYSYVNPPSSCDGKTFATVTTDEQNGSILLNVAVSVNDANISTEPIRYFRRTIQKL